MLFFSMGQILYRLEIRRNIMQTLPEAFVQLRQPLLKEEWSDFLKSYECPKTYGLRQNPLKSCGKLPFTLEPVPWTKEGFYADPEERPGKHPLHEAGVYYIQEPSAMSVVSLLDPKPGDVVCDLCAAPGGKSTQIGGRLQGQGLLVSNEIFPARARILSQNIERMGIANAIVCNEPPDRMAAFFPFYFDRIVVDAPCSGEGMFRKDDTAIEEWSPENVQICVERQKMILNHADEMLKPGGVLVYSTCTFAPEENEEMIAWFLATHPGYILEDWKETPVGADTASFSQHAGLSNGNPEWVNWDKLQQECEAENLWFPEKRKAELTKTLRLWPHKLKGEGHFAARLRKGRPTPSIEEYAENETINKKKSSKKKKNHSEKSGLSKEIISDWEDFQQKFLIAQKASIPNPKQNFSNGRFELFGEEIYFLPRQAPALKGLKVVRGGLHVGTTKKNRFEPSYAFAKALTKQQVKNSLDCSLEDAIRYLKGETLSCDSSLRGWTLVCYENCPLGWGKAQNGICKNHFPKGLRWMSS